MKVWRSRQHCWVCSGKYGSVTGTAPVTRVIREYLKMRKKMIKLGEGDGS